MKLLRLTLILLLSAGLLVATLVVTGRVALAPTAENGPRLPIASNQSLDNANLGLQPPAILAVDLEIPSLGIRAPIIYSESADEDVFQSHLENGVVHYPGTAYPGELGNAYIVGHSSDYLYRPGNFKRVFSKLPDITVGADVIVRDKDGKELLFRVVETKIVNPDQVDVLSQYDYERRLLSVQTSYPVNTARQRFIALAELVEPASTNASL